MNVKKVVKKVVKKEVKMAQMVLAGDGDRYRHRPHTVWDESEDVQTYKRKPLISVVWDPLRCVMFDKGKPRGAHRPCSTSTSDRCLGI